MMHTVRTEEDRIEKKRKILWYTCTNKQRSSGEVIENRLDNHLTNEPIININNIDVDMIFFKWGGRGFIHIWGQPGHFYEEGLCIEPVNVCASYIVIHRRGFCQGDEHCGTFIPSLPNPLLITLPNKILAAIFCVWRFLSPLFLLFRYVWRT